MFLANAATAPASGSDDSRTQRLMHDRAMGLVIAAFFSVHRELGFGFVDAVYQRALSLEFLQRGLSLAQDVPISVFYKGTKIGHFRAPFVVEGRLVVDVRAGLRADANDERQLSNCVRASGCEAGLLLHFGPAATFRHVEREPALAVSTLLPKSRPDPA